MAFPRAPTKIIPFNSGPVAAHDIGRQFDEHTASLNSVLEFLRKVIREDGKLQNGIIGAEQLSPEIMQTIAKGVISEAEKLLADVRSIAAEAAAVAGEARRSHYEIASYEHSLSHSASVLQEEAKAARVQLLQAVTSQLTSPPTGVLGPTTAMPGFYGVDPLGASATAQDYAVVSMEWAEHMPDTIPPNILALNAITGDHWSSRWWANKSANAMGMLAWWYQGAWPQPGPPSTPYTITGDPLPIGGMYYDTTLNTMMVWNGSTWVNAAAPQKAVTASLYYLATANQTIFPLSVLDRNGKNFGFNQVDPEGVISLVNGVRVEPTFDFTVDTVGSIITFLRPLPAGVLVIFDLLTPADRLAPVGSANTFIVNPITPNGVTTVFSGLTMAANAELVNIGKNEEIFISVDGVHQQPGASYTATGSTVTFSQPPGADSNVYMIWFGPDSGGGGGGVVDAPNDGQLYGRKNLAWSLVPPPGGGGIAPSTLLPLMDGVAASGVSLAYSREDHVHPNASPAASTTMPLMDGTPAVGSGTTWARADHVHPIDTSRYAAANPAGYQTAAQVTASLGPYALTSSLPAPSASNPLMDGAAAPGSSAVFSRGDHVHPVDSSRAAQAALANYLPLAGGTMTGGLTMSGTAIQTNNGIYLNGAGPNNGNLSSSNGGAANAGWSAASFFFATASGVGYATLTRSDSTSAYLNYFLAGGNNVGNIYTNGTTTAYNTASDRSLKDNIRDLASDIDVGELIDRIKPVAFEWKATAPEFDVVAASAPRSNIGHGFIAQELYEVVPLAVTPPLPIGPGKRDPKDGPHLWGADFSKLVPYLVAELQALRKRVAELEAP